MTRLRFAGAGNKQPRYAKQAQPEFDVKTRRSVPKTAPKRTSSGTVGSATDATHENMALA